MEKVIGLITARGGSKGLPRKNIKLLAGKPLIAWTIECAMQSRLLDKLVVSTDDLEIADISRSFGAEVPFLRPQELATDEARSIDVILHALEWFESRGVVFKEILLLQPTSPLRIPLDLQNVAELFQQKQAGAVVSVCECEHSPLWMNSLGPDLSMRNFVKPEHSNKNRQQLEKYYRLNGALYWGKVEYLRQNQGFLGENTYAYIMPQQRSVDIDSELDFKLAELIMKEHTHLEENN